jgi:hypothetical protein
MSEPSPRVTRSGVGNALILGIIGVVAPLLIVGVFWVASGEAPTLWGAAPPQIPPPNTLASFTLSVASPSVTLRAVSPDATVLVIVGAVYAEGIPSRDLFYRYTDEFGISLDTPVCEPLGLQVGIIAYDCPPYSPFHVYTMPLGNAAEPTLTVRLNIPLELNMGAFDGFITGAQ